MLLLECAKCSYTVDVEETEIISKHSTNAMLSAVSLTDVYILLLLYKLIPLWNNLCSTVLPDAPVPRRVGSPGPKLSGGQVWINNECSGLIIRTVDLSSGIFYGFYHQGLRPRYSVTGQVNPEANTVAFTVSWRNHFTNLLAVSAYSGHLQYLANGDTVFRSTYILTRKGGRTEIGSDVFYPAEIAPPIACPRK